MTILDLEGRMGWGDDLSALKAQVDDLLGQRRSLFIINLEDVPLMDTSGIAAIVSSYVTVANRGGQLKLARPHTHIQEILSLTKLDTVLEVFGSELDALRSVSPES